MWFTSLYTSFVNITVCICPLPLIQPWIHHLNNSSNSRFIFANSDLSETGQKEINSTLHISHSLIHHTAHFDSTIESEWNLGAFVCLFIFFLALAMIMNDSQWMLDIILSLVLSEFRRSGIGMMAYYQGQHVHPGELGRCLGYHFRNAAKLLPPHPHYNWLP